MITYIWLIALIVLSNTILLHISIQKKSPRGTPVGISFGQLQSPALLLLKDDLERYYRYSIRKESGMTSSPADGKRTVPGQRRRQRPEQPNM